VNLSRKELFQALTRLKTIEIDFPPIIGYTSKRDTSPTMIIHDITLTLSPELPVWPGDPPISLERITQI